MGETFWLQDYKLLCIKDKGFAVVEARADKQLPTDGGYWLSIKNMKKDIKFLRKLDHEKPSLRDRLLIRKLKRQLK